MLDRCNLCSWAARVTSPMVRRTHSRPQQNIGSLECASGTDAIPKLMPWRGCHAKATVKTKKHPASFTEGMTVKNMVAQAPCPT